VLTDKQRQDLDTQGYVVVERFLSPEMLNEVRERVEELYTQ